jgi:signal transduction histidine kinase
MSEACRVLGSVKLWCCVLLAGAWVLDLLTPQLFIAAIFLNVPIALSSLALDVRFTRRLIVLALAACVAAGYVNAQTEHQWNMIAVADRVVSGFSFFLVGTLSIAAQRSARRAGELSERSEREARESRVGQALERIRESMSIALIEYAIAREACRSLGADVAWYYTQTAPLDPSTAYCCRRGGEVEVSYARPAPPIASLLQRVADAGHTVRVEAGDPFGRLVLDTLGVAHALAVPLVERGTLFGVLLIGMSSDLFDADAEQALRYYADRSAIASAQGKLFEELARRNTALAERNEVIRDIVYALSHDLRTPLEAANMTMRQALEGRYGELPSAYHEILERSVQSNDELRRLAETLLLVSRYESGEASQYRERVDLTEITREATHELQALARDKNVILRTEGDTTTVLADRGEMRRAAVNLVANALAWTPSGGCVVVRTSVHDARARVAVEDTGFGVPADLVGVLFQRIAGASRHGGGSGLGLYIVRRIAEGHGGSVAYQPRAEGGSVFTMDLPLAGGTP